MSISFPLFEHAWNQIGFYVFLSLFLLMICIHLYFCFKMIPKYRKITKPFCMLFLGTAFAFWVPQYPLIWISCYLSMLGDLLLIQNKVPKYFVVGAMVFAAAHTLNFTNQIILLSYSISWLVYVGIAVGILLIGFLGYCFRGKENAQMAAVGASYACFHILNIIFAILLMIDGKPTFEVWILAGYIVYVISDFIVNYVTNIKDINRRDFYIMLTYLLGQCGIYFGLTLTLLSV